MKKITYEDHIRYLNIEESDNPVKKFIRKSVLVGLVATIYVAACIPNSIKVSEALKGTEYADMFTTAAENGGVLRFDPNTARSYLDYDGTLNDILKQTDDFLKSNSSFRLGKWVSRQNYEIIDGQETLVIQAITPTTVFCYNPFKKID